jgi:hypothetical protein
MLDNRRQWAAAIAGRRELRGRTPVTTFVLCELRQDRFVRIRAAEQWQVAAPSA